MYSTAQKRWHPIPLPATLDTGTEDNWIDETLLEALELEPKLEATAVEFLNFSGKTVKSNATVDIPWCAAEGNRKIYTNKFRVAHAAPFEVVLGRILIQDRGILVFNKTAWILTKKDASESKHGNGDREALTTPHPRWR
jgi:hypothetical protein